MVENTICVRNNINSNNYLILTNNLFFLYFKCSVTESLFVKKDPENKTINSFVENVLKQLQLQLKTVQDDAIKQKLSNASLNISNKFLSDPLVLYIGLRKWVLIERQLEKLSQEEYVNYSHVFNLIQDIVSRVELNKETIKSLNLVNSWLDVEVCENNSLIYQEQSSSFSLKATEELKSILKLIDNLQNRVIVFLKTWQNNEICVRKGQLKSNTAALDIIQSWFEQTADLLCSTRKQLNALKTNFQEQSKPIYQELDEKNYKLLIQLINNSFIVEEQPSLVLRTKTK